MEKLQKIEEAKNNRCRDDFLDYIRGLIMVIVVYGHCANCVWGEPNPLPWKTIAGTFTMPLYMAISGYLLYKSCKKYDLERLISGKVMRILVPCYIWELPLVLFSGSANIWYLHASFICSVVLILIIKLVQFPVYRNIALFGSVFIAFIIPSDYCYLAWMHPFLVMGYFVGEICESRQQEIKRAGGKIVVFLGGTCT